MSVHERCAYRNACVGAQQPRASVAWIGCLGLHRSITRKTRGIACSPNGAVHLVTYRKYLAILFIGNAHNVLKVLDRPRSPLGGFRSSSEAGGADAGIAITISVSCGYLFPQEDGLWLRSPRESYEKVNWEM